MLTVNFLALFVLSVHLNLARGSECAPHAENPQICVCNSTYCDTTPTVEWCLKDKVMNLYLTSENGDRFTIIEEKFEDADGFNNNIVDFVLDVDPCKSYQNITGFGGALTDAATKMINSLSDEAQIYLMLSYFDDKNGLGYNYLRVPLGSSDASERNYTYDDNSEEDPLLITFSLAKEDKDLKIPLIKMAQNISGAPLLLIGTTWYAPEWMTSKADNSSLPTISPKYFESWAKYYLRALEEYQSQGINFTYLTPANEPIMAFSSLQWTSYSYQFWINQYLCPMIKNSTFKDVRLLLLDDKTNYLPFWQMMLFDPTTNDCASGFATQWYSDPLQLAVKLIQETFCWLFPDKELQSTEASICQSEEDYNETTDFDKANRYARNIITKLGSCTTAFLDYNLALDTDGGPSFQDNYCYSAISINSSSGEFYKKPLFYYLGHFSKFIPPGSVRTEILMYPPVDFVDYVAFKVDSPNCTQQNLVIVILNTAEIDYKANICYGSSQCTSIIVPHKSIISTVSSIPSEIICQNK